MQILRSQDANYVVLTDMETGFLKCVLNRYHQGKGIITPGDVGFTYELLEKLTRIPTPEYDRIYRNYKEGVTE